MVGAIRAIRAIRNSASACGLFVSSFRRFGVLSVCAGVCGRLFHVESTGSSLHCVVALSRFARFGGNSRASRIRQTEGFFGGVFLCRLVDGFRVGFRVVTRLVIQGWSGGSFKIIFLARMAIIFNKRLMLLAAFS